MLSEGRRSLHQAIESMMVISFSRFLRSSSRCSNKSSLRPSVHEAASTTTGNFPPSLQRHSASLICSDIHVCPRLYPLELHGVEQQRPLTSLGIQRGLPARSERATKVSGSAGAAGLVLSLPKMRLMHAGKYAAAAPGRLVWGRSAGAACGMGPATVGTRSLLTMLRATSVRASSRSGLVIVCTTSAALTPRRASFSISAHFLATSSASSSAPAECCIFLKWLIRAPVLIPIGQTSAQVPSPAHISIASYSYSCCSWVSSFDHSGCRDISRRRTIRCLGVTVTLRLGHTGSQKPHSMQ